MFSALQEIPISLVERVPMYEQQKFKYQIYVDGHVAAMRYASMMVLGSVIFKVFYSLIDGWLTGVDNYSCASIS